MFSNIHIVDTVGTLRWPMPTNGVWVVHPLTFDTPGLHPVLSHRRLLCWTRPYPLKHDVALNSRLRASHPPTDSREDSDSAVEAGEVWISFLTPILPEVKSRGPVGWSSKCQLSGALRISTINRPMAMVNTPRAG